MSEKDAKREEMKKEAHQIEEGEDDDD